LAELKALWDAGGPWTETLDAWAEGREAALPRLGEIVGDLMSGESSASEFRREMDSFSKQTKYGGFHGTSGQMFLNTLVNAGAEDELGAALRSALPPPQDEEDCRRKFAEFLAFVEDARERARQAGTAIPSLGYAPYFLSFFWEAADRDTWPIYYPNSRATLAAHGLFTETGPHVDRYLRFRELILRLRDELGTGTWGVESLLWHLKTGSAATPKPEGEDAGDLALPEDLYESYQSQGLIFPDEVITSLVLSLTTKPFVLLSGISGTGKTQIAIGLAEYLDRRAAGATTVVVAPESDDSNIFIRLTDARLRRGRTGLTREHQATLAIHGLPERGSSRDYQVTLPEGVSGTMRLNNIGFSDPRDELYLLSFRNPLKRWLSEHAAGGDYLQIGFDEEGAVSTFEVVQPERRETEAPARRHEIIAVRSDWTDPRGLIGYENPLTGEYTRTPLIDLLLRAEADGEHPYIVILDEMNLARVEYYFSDVLSAMEIDGGTISLREAAAERGVDDEEVEADVPARLALPPNVLVIGTVNIDETTHGFSPKVLDRANVIVFNDVDAQRFLEGRGEAAASTFRLAAAELEPRSLVRREEAVTTALARGTETVAFTEPLVQVHELLKNHNLHFGYRVIQEMTTYAGLALEGVEGDEDEIARTAFDLQLVQKVLPKFNGGRELERPLAQLLAFCLDGAPRKNVDAETVLQEAWTRLRVEASFVGTEALAADAEQARAGATDESPVSEGDAPASGGPDEAQAEVASPSPAMYPRASRELARMLTRLRISGFVSYLE
jgi:hypothetical protein